MIYHNRFGFYFALSIALLLISGQAFSMNIQVQGSTVAMSGPVVGPECADLQRIISTNKITSVVLTQSSGGNADAGYCVGSLIRRNRIATSIEGTCNSSCSRMWLGGISRTLIGADSRVGLHGNYEHGQLMPIAPARLRAWLTGNVRGIDRNLMEQWIKLPHNNDMMYFYNGHAELCASGSCVAIPGRNARNVGLSTR
jgi:hypothetical protein